MEKNLSQVYSIDKGKSKSVIVDEISIEDSKSEYAYKSANKEKSAKKEAEYEERLVTDITVFKQMNYFNIFKSDKKYIEQD